MTFVQECLLSLSLLQSLGITQKICHTAESSSWLLLITLQFRFFFLCHSFFPLCLWRGTNRQQGMNEWAVSCVIGSIH